MSTCLPLFALRRTASKGSPPPVSPRATHQHSDPQPSTHSMQHCTQCMEAWWPTASLPAAEGCGLVCMSSRNLATSCCLSLDAKVRVRQIPHERADAVVLQSCVGMGTFTMPPKCVNSSHFSWPFTF